MLQRSFLFFVENYYWISSKNWKLVSKMTETKV